MLDSYSLKVPAKINLFLNVLNKREDGLHNIRSGVTFINLFDKITIVKSDNLEITYSGKFKPINNFYKDCIIKKTLNYLKLSNKINLSINVEKNIPTNSGLGSASTNAAGLIQGLRKMNIIKIEDNKHYSSIGADIPVCLLGKNAIITGIGEQVKETSFPKYFFLLVKPNINLSTKEMYDKISKKINSNTNNHYDDNINDFEEIATYENQDIKKILMFLKNCEKAVFARMSGSGSCCYAVFNKIDYAKKANKHLQQSFSKFWTFLAKN